MLVLLHRYFIVNSDLVKNKRLEALEWAGAEARPLGPRSERTTACVYLLQSPLLRSVVNIRYVPQHCLSWSCPGPGAVGIQHDGCQPRSSMWPPALGPRALPTHPELPLARSLHFLSLLSSSVFRTLVNPTVLQSDAGLCPFLPYHSNLPCVK